MRLPRAYSLPKQSIFHLIWKTINGEFLLNSDEVKSAFLDRLFKFFSRSGGNVLVYAFVLMSNHFHEAAELSNDCSFLSRWIRSAHSSFALWLNRRLGRCGPIGLGRPKTLVAQNQESLKRIMFYFDWNPVRAGMCRHPSDYYFSSYRYYAYGEINEWTKHLTRPEWYIKLGNTDKKRQMAYVRLCDEYYYKDQLPSEAEADQGHMIGVPKLVAQRNSLMRTLARFISKHILSRPELDRYVGAALSPGLWSSVAELCPEASRLLETLGRIESQRSEGLTKRSVTETVLAA